MQYVDSDNSAVDREAMIVNILGWFDGASASVKKRGPVWYLRMARIVHGHAARLGVSPLAVAGVYAAWSINNGWRNNLRQARFMLTGRQARGLGMSIHKAMTCIADNAPIFISDAKARKIHSFAANLAGDFSAVTVDRWALRVAYGERARIVVKGKVKDGYVPTGSEYDAIAYAYTLAALLRDVEPAVMQAVTWLAIREAYGEGRKVGKASAS